MAGIFLDCLVSNLVPSEPIVAVRTGSAASTANATPPESTPESPNFALSLNAATEQISSRAGTHVATEGAGTGAPTFLTGANQPVAPQGATSAGTGDGAVARPPRIVVYRRPLAARADSEEELGELVFEVVVEEFARLLGVDPEDVDPGFGDE